MSTIFQADVQSEVIELAVYDPGLAEPNISTSYAFDDQPEWTAALHGADLGRLLTEITRPALGTNEHDTTSPAVVPDHITTADDRNLLRHVQHAALLAAAGTDRYHRVLSAPIDWPTAASH